MMVDYFLPIIYFVALGITYVVELLNLRQISFTLPEQFKGYYKQTRYSLSQKYLKEKTLISLFEGTYSTALLLGFVFLGGFNKLNEFSQGISGNNLIQAFVFFSIFTLLNTLVSIPISIYETFYTEEKYKFNKTTPMIFATDLIKSTLLMLGIGGGIFLLIFSIFNTYGGGAWLIAWMAVTLLSFLLTFIAPVIFLPLFNKFTPLPDGELREKIFKLAKNHSFKLQGIFTMDSSKRSTKSNAFFIGFGKFKRIVLFDTLIKNFTTDEIVAVLAHELGHFKRGHIKKNFVISIAIMGLTFYLFSNLIDSSVVFKMFKIETQNTYVGILIAMVLLLPAQELLSLITNWFSRKFEYEADQYAKKATKDHKLLVKALKKLTVENLGNLNPHPLKVLFDYSHPPVIERIKALEDTNT